MTKININFAHANGFPAQSYKQLFIALGSDFTVMAKDKYAHNERFPLVNNWHHQIDEMIHFVELERAQMSPEELARPMIAVGHSFGATLSYMVCCKRPDLFDQLVMLDPPLITGLASLAFRLLKKTSYIDKVTPAGLTKIRRRNWHQNDNLVEYFRAKALFKNMDVTCIEDYVEAVTHSQNGRLNLNFDVDIEANIFRTLPTNLASFYGKLSMPATLITGKHTNVCVPALYRPFIKGNPSVEHVQLPSGGHMFPLEVPQAVANQIKQSINLASL